MTPDELADRARLAGLRATVGVTAAPQPYEATAERCPLLISHEGRLLTIGRPDFRSEGLRQPCVRLDIRNPKKTDAGRVDAFLCTAARLQAREGAIVGHDTPHLRYPAWSFRGDSLALALARLHGIDIADCVRPATWRAAVDPPHGRPVSPDSAWDWSRETTYVRGAKVKGETPGCGIVTTAEMKGDRLFMRVLSAGGGVHLREQMERTFLVLEQTFPETLLAALVGRRVSDIVDIDCEHVVTRASQDAAGTMLLVKGPLAPVSTAPEGVDAWWLEV